MAIDVSGASTSSRVNSSFESFSGPGVYVPPGFGKFWKPKRDGAGSAKATIAVIGDSIAHGEYCTNFATKSWARLVAADLQTTYGNGGSGFLGAYSSTVNGALSGYTNLTGLVATTGTWSTNKEGPGNAYMLTSVAGSTATFYFTGTTMKIYYLKTSTGGSGAGRWDYAIDGGSAVTINSYAASPTMAVVTVTGLSAGAHTVVITMGALSGYGVICGVAGENSTGVILNNFARTGARSAEWVTAGASYSTDVVAWNGGFQYQCDLLIWSVAVNDAHDAVAVDTWLGSVKTFLDGVRGHATMLGAVDIMFVLPHIVGWDNATPQYHLYSQRLRGICDAYNAAMVNVWSAYRNNATYWHTTLGYSSNGTPTGNGTDLHPNDAGHQAIADLILPVLKS